MGIVIPPQTSATQPSRRPPFPCSRLSSTSQSLRPDYPVCPTPCRPTSSTPIFTFLLLICTLKSTVAFFFLFFTLDLAFLLLGIAYLRPVDGAPSPGCTRAGGAFGILAAFAAWYNALAGIADTSNSFFIIPVAHFPWSEKGKAARAEKRDVEHQA